MSKNLTSSRNLTMLTDFYEITMGQGYFKEGFTHTIGIFDMFFRKTPDDAGFAIFAGLEQLIYFLQNLSFTEEDLEFLSDTKLFSSDFLNYLRDFKFECDVWSVPEGTPIFPQEPVITIKGPIIQAQFIETMILTTLNHQSLVATKANRVVRAAKGKPIMEFGARRAQGSDAAIYGSRAAYIGGCDATSCVISAAEYGLPMCGTMAHSWVLNFESEYDAFCEYSKIYPNNCVLLIDTYNVLKSGLPNAIKAFDNVLKPKGIRPSAVRIDSGDIAYLSKKVREKLNQTGYKDVKIIASNSLDEYLISDLITQESAVDIFAVGENLITSKSSPVFGGVYKLAAVEKGGMEIPKMKLSENPQKVNIPYFKTVYRFFSKETNQAVADLVALKREEIDCKDGITIFDPVRNWKKKRLQNVIKKELPIRIFNKGKLVYKTPKLKDIRDYCLKSVDCLWEEVKRFNNPHKYYVDLSQNLWRGKNELIEKIQRDKPI